MGGKYCLRKTIQCLKVIYFLFVFCVNIVLPLLLCVISPTLLSSDLFIILNVKIEMTSSITQVKNKIKSSLLNMGYNLINLGKKTLTIKLYKYFLLIFNFLFNGTFSNDYFNCLTSLSNYSNSALILHFIPKIS